MATSRLMPLHIGKGRSAASAIDSIIEYVENPEKTDGGRLITSYGCDSLSAGEDFMLSKRQYIQMTGRVRGEDDIIAYHMRQSFKPGEITPEEANKIGHELARSFTKGKCAYIVCTHIDKAHIHNHIIFNSVQEDCTRKFRNFLGSAWALRRINDKLCLVHGLSIVDDPKPSRGHYGTWLGDNKPLSFSGRLRAAIDDALAQKPADFDTFLRLLEDSSVSVDTRGKYIKLRMPEQQKNTRLDSLGADYTESAIRERIAGKRATPLRGANSKKERVGLLIDIEKAMQSGKGKGYERWAKVYNIKQLSKAVIYLKENGDMTFDELTKKADVATRHFGELTDRIKDAEAKMSKSAALQKHIVTYAKTRDIYTAYRKAGYSKAFRAEHEAEIILHQAAKKAFDDMGVKKLPTIAVLRKDYADALKDKKEAYAHYKQARETMRELGSIKANLESLLFTPDAERDRSKTRE